MFVYASDRWEHKYDGGTEVSECSRGTCSCHPSYKQPEDVPMLDYGGGVAIELRAAATLTVARWLAPDGGAR